jgi:hypothetical protein
MNAGITWLKQVIIATAALTAIGLLAGTSHAFAAETAGEGGSVAHAASVFAVAWLLSSLRLHKKRGRWHFGFELSPVHRVMALSTVRRARSRH